MKLEIFCDGGARGNPGPAAIGVVIQDTNGKKIFSFGKTIGKTTNNVAEYTAVIEALLWVAKNIPKKSLEIDFYLDSLLIVMQMIGRYKIKDPKLQLLFAKIHRKTTELGATISYHHIPRAQNSQADRLVNIALNAV